MEMLGLEVVGICEGEHCMLLRGLYKNYEVRNFKIEKLSGTE
jgi:hypothetical protein